jgi:glycerol-3-phosphate acyltransferase PlsY
VGLAAFLGHLYPIFFGFHGGKGVATALGVLLGLAWPVALAVLATWLVMAKVFRISSLSAITAAAAAPLYTWLLEDSIPLLVMVCVISAMLLWRHRGNIQRLMSGAEGKIGP